MGIGMRTFYECRSLTSVNIPESVVSIGVSAFQGCSNLISITIPKNVTRIPRYAFRGCTNLTSIIIPESVTIIDNGAFANCSSLTSITLPISVTSIELGAFRDCSGLTSITLPEYLTNIGHYVFEGCSNLTSVTFPAGVAKIGNYIFLHCNNLKTIYCYAEIVPETSTNAFASLHPENATLYVPYNVVNSYKATEPWSSFGTITSIEETAVITTSQYGSGTYCCDKALDFSKVDGLKAYAATGYNTTTGVVTLTRVMTSKAGVGLFVKGVPGDYFVPEIEESDDNTLNMLVGTLESVVVNRTSSDGLYANYKYTVKEGDEEPLFYPFADGSTLNSGKAYLQIPVTWLSTETKAISCRFDEGTTELEELECEEGVHPPFFDLMGRQVLNPQKGCLYITNGKKVVY